MTVSRQSAVVDQPGAIRRGPFQVGDRVQLTDPKGRMHTIVLEPGKSYHTHRGALEHDELIGLPEGSAIETPAGETMLVLRPTYAQLIPNLPRQAQPIYPKDVGPILLWGDIGAGMHVVEVGTGPGALTIALIRTVGPTGRVTSYEAREDFARLARENVARYLGETPNWTLRVGDAFAGLAERGVDRMVIDLAEPWRLLDQVTETLRPGGVVTSFIPTALQVKQLVDALRAHGGFGAVETLETLTRFWHVSERSLRPTHRMVAHTGFLVFARRLASIAARRGARPDPAAPAPGALQLTPQKP